LLSDTQKADFIKMSSLGDSLPAEVLSLIVIESDVEMLKKKSEIIGYNEKSDYFYLIYSGIVKVSRESGNKEVIYRFLKPGDFFGDLSILCSCHNFFSKYAVTDLILIRIDNSIFLNVLQDNPQLLINIISKYTSEICRLAELIFIYNNPSSRAKFIYLLSELYDLCGYQKDGKYILEILMTQQEMAGFCGMERTTLFREIKKQEKLGNLVQDKHRWQILGELLSNLKL